MGKNKKCDICGDIWRIKFSKKFNMFLCSKHEHQLYDHGEIRDKTKSQAIHIPLKCEICGREDDTVYNNKKYKKILCNKHREQLNRNGIVLPRTVYDKNNIIIDGNIAKIELRDKNCKIVDYAIIDKDDIKIIEKYKWHKDDHGYVKCKIDGKQFPLQRMICPSKLPLLTDHINGNRLDNRKINLRVCTYSENNRNRFINSKNTSGVTGVYFKTRENKWCAMIKINQKKIELGCFENKNDAINVRQRAEIKYFGEFSPLISRSGWDRDKILIAFRTPTGRRYYTDEQYAEYMGRENNE